MWWQQRDNLYEAVLLELAQAESRSLTPRRLSGLFALLALCAWVGGGLWSANYALKGILTVNAGLVLGQLYATPQPESSPAVNSADMESELGAPALAAEMTDAQRQKILDDWFAARQEHIAKREAAQKELTQQKKAEWQALNQQIERYRFVQGAVMIGWSILMSLTAGVMLGAALAGLFGAVRTRQWHRLVAVLILLSTIGTVAGLWLLSRYGGFPQPDYSLVATIAAIQISYAIAIIFTLLLTRRSEIDWLTKLS
ncbi:MAG: hypothetical protein HJJLKODD_02239 [Phycisphaerae bacterium]|nr:hypothetical protein [Phycisphaerae bacterium]